MSRRPVRWAGAAALAAALLVSGCGLGRNSPSGATPVHTPDSGSVSSPNGGPGPDHATDPRYARYYEQTVDWSECGGEVECGSVTVPVDWEQPDGPTLQIALAKRAATGERQGALLVNFGGPGMAGADLVRRYPTAGSSSRKVRQVYDLVGFDPRGTGGSSALDCVDDRQLDDFLSFDPEADPETDLPATLRELDANAQPFIQGCARDAGPLLAHLDSLSVVQDMDVIRAALGDDRLNYLGYSYGTLLGALYADSRPQRVGRMVLDGVLDPASSFNDLEVGQAAGMEQALRAFVEWCLDEGRGCVLTGSVDEGMNQIGELLVRADHTPIPTDGRPLTAPLAMTGIISPLYEDAAWPNLNEALGEAFDGDGTALLELGDEYSDRAQDGEYTSNINEIFNAVKCVDYPVSTDPAELEASADRIEKAAPVVGRYMSYSEALCAQWPARATRVPGPVTGAGAPGILVLGTTGDPATPFTWAKSLANQLQSGVLLTFEGEGHTAYQRGSRCVDRAVDSYLVDGLLVPDGTVCE